MSYTRGNRIRSTGAIEIVPMPTSKTGYCGNDHRSADGGLRSAGYSITLIGYPFGIYCKKCADEIWRIWTEALGIETTKGEVVKKKPKGQSKSNHAVAEREKEKVAA